MTSLGTHWGLSRAAAVPRCPASTCFSLSAEREELTSVTVVTGALPAGSPSSLSPAAQHIHSLLDPNCHLSSANYLALQNSKVIPPLLKCPSFCVVSNLNKFSHEAQCSSYNVGNSSPAMQLGGCICLYHGSLQPWTQRWVCRQPDTRPPPRTANHCARQMDVWRQQGGSQQSSSESWQAGGCREGKRAKCWALCHHDRNMKLSIDSVLFCSIKY